MKLIIDIGGNKFLLSMAVADKLTKALAEAEWLEHRYVAKEVSPTSYVDLISPLVLSDLLKFGAMDDATYGALKLTTNLYNAKAAK